MGALLDGAVGAVAKKNSGYLGRQNSRNCFLDRAVLASSDKVMTYFS